MIALFLYPFISIADLVSSIVDLISSIAVLIYNIVVFGGGAGRVAQFDYLWEGGPEFAQSKHFRFGTDAVLLGNYMNLTGAKKAIDLGCASGVIALLMLARSRTVHVTGLEINADAADLAAENMAHNNLSDRSSILQGDIRKVRETLPAGSFDVVVSNPPYYALNTGRVSPDADRAAARGEVACTLDDLCAAASYLCRWGGKFAVVYRPDRLAELFTAMTGHGIEPKRMRIVCHDISSVPSLVLVEGIRGGKPGLKLEPVLLLKNPDGTDTEEIKRIYHRE